MLMGLFVFLFGLGVLFRSISLVFIFTPLFVLLNALELKAIEEPELEKRFGKEYVEYKKRVPMFIPRLKKRNGERGCNMRRSTSSNTANRFTMNLAVDKTHKVVIIN
jgi:hypothetical protein